jgi:hypothetical protein
MKCAMCVDVLDRELSGCVNAGYEFNHKGEMKRVDLQRYAGGREKEREKAREGGRGEWAMYG